MPIGLAITASILMFGVLTGATVNPARWFGPALVTGRWDDAAVWIVGPVVGGLLAGLMYRYIMKPVEA
jgi:glycerol uptake facilitator-like aquaporin